MSATRSEPTDHRHGFAAGAGAAGAGADGSEAGCGGVPASPPITGSSGPPRGRTTRDAPRSSRLATAARSATKSIGSTATAQCFQASAGISTSGTRISTSSSVTVPRRKWRPPVANRCTTDAPSSPASWRQPTFGT